jgi:hypothetical protein
LDPGTYLVLHATMSGSLKYIFHVAAWKAVGTA